MNSVARIELKELDVNIVNSLIVGVIIAKRSFKEFPSNNNKSPRGVWSFTFRDSIEQFVNVTCWGSSKYIKSLEDSFQVGDVVDLIRTEAKVRNLGDKNEAYAPDVTSPFTLVFNEGQSEIVIHDGDNYEYYKKLLQIPTKSLKGVFSLNDIETHATNMRGSHVDLLVGIRTIGPVKTINTRDRKQQEVREIILQDQTHQGFSVSLWEKEIIDRASQWEPRKTVLFVVNARVDYKVRPVINFNSKTLVTVDPLIKQAEALIQHMNLVASQNKSTFSKIDVTMPDLHSIRNILSLANVQQKISMMSEEESQDEFTCVTYCTILRLDLTESALALHCGICNGKVDLQIGACFNLECPAGSGTEQIAPIIGFDLRVDLSDHTGELTNVLLSGNAAVNIFECTPEEFKSMFDSERIELKWKFLLQRCEIKLLISNKNYKNVQVYMISCKPFNLYDVANKIPLF